MQARAQASILKKHSKLFAIAQSMNVTKRMSDAAMQSVRHTQEMHMQKQLQLLEQHSDDST
jgi:hypothetical protein